MFGYSHSVTGGLFVMIGIILWVDITILVGVRPFQGENLVGLGRVGMPTQTIGLILPEDFPRTMPPAISIYNVR